MPSRGEPGWGYRISTPCFVNALRQEDLPGSSSDLFLGSFVFCFLSVLSSFFNFYSCLPLLSSNSRTKQKQTRKRNPSLVQRSVLSLWCRACHRPLCSALWWGKWPKFALKWRQFLPKRNSCVNYWNIKHLTPLHSRWETNLFFQFPLSCSFGWCLHWRELSSHILTLHGGCFISQRSVPCLSCSFLPPLSSEMGLD